MLVQDYPREMSWDEPVIVVPAFHAGHLGLVPGTTVSVALTRDPAPGDGVARSNPEVVISQFEPDISPLAVLSVTLHEEVGVVERLTAAVSSLGINIELQESNSIHQLNEHHVTLLLSMTARPAPVPNARTLYDPYREILPIDDPGLVRLFEHVMLHCIDIIAWRVRDGRWMPAIEIRSLPRHPYTRQRQATVERADGASHIRLPENVVGRLRSQMRHEAEPTVCYLFISDTDQRNLRVFFLRSDARDRLFHLAFHHNDQPGALTTILGLVAKAKFNIMTSLLRKHESGRSVWETVLEYHGTAEPPQLGRSALRIGTQEELAWVADRIHESAGDDIVPGVNGGIELNVPNYRRRGVDREAFDPVPIGQGLRFSGEVPYVPASTLLDNANARLKASLPTLAGDPSAIKELVNRIGRRLRGLTRPTIFLSYPQNADEHVAMVKAALESQFDLVDYRMPDNEVLTDQVVKRIAAADFFIGIWHHEEPSDKSARYTLSPWMPYEYGIARALLKPAIVVHSHRLPPEIWNRIESGIAHPEYTELTFWKTVDLIKDHCQERFRYQ